MQRDGEIALRLLLDRMLERARAKFDEVPLLADRSARVSQWLEGKPQRRSAIGRADPLPNAAVRRQHRQAIGPAEAAVQKSAWKK